MKNLRLKSFRGGFLFLLWLYFLGMPLISNAAIFVKKQYGPVPYPTSYSDVPWVSSAEKACDLVLLRRQQDWPPPVWTFVKGDPYVQLAPGASVGSCSIFGFQNGQDWGQPSGVVYVRNAPCPSNSYPGGASGECECNQGYSEVGNSCEPLPPPPMCPGSPPQSGEMTPNPILLAAAQKYQNEIDYADHLPHPLSFSRNYLSGRASGPGNLGGGWGSSYSDALTYRPATESDTALVIVNGSGGGRTVFTQSNGVWIPKDSVDTLVQTSQGWIYGSNIDNGVRQFDLTGKLLSHTLRNGWIYQYTYDNQGRLQRVTNHFGRSLELLHNTLGQVVGVVVDGQLKVAYGYDSMQRLALVRFADNSSKSYLYENVGFPQALTGIVDENGVRLATYNYNSDGQPIQTIRAGGVGRYRVSYGQRYYDSTTVTDPLGTQRSYTYNLNLGKVAVASSTSPDAGGAADAATRTQSALGLIDLETDFLGVSTTHDWDTSRRVPLTITEAVGRVESRSTQYQWHPQWRLPTRIIEQGRVTEYTYDERGNRLSETITDPSGTTRTTSWTYNTQSLVASETAPNGALSTYQYDSYGNLTQTANALGHTHRYTHDAAGRILSHTAPNGLVITYTYDLRGRMLSTSAGGLTSLYSYTPSGQLASVQLPHGHRIAYQYDAAQRLIGWSDNRGATGTYQLDPMGNRTREEIRNAQGQQVWLLVRSINSLNRVDSTTQAGQTTRYGYDSNGDLVSTTNGLGETTSYGLDALRRVQTLSNAAWATASLSYNAQDAITQARDFKGVATQYARDALGNATQEASPDSGTQSTQYDVLGLPASITDALGRATTIERDLLGRPTRITHPEGSATTLYYDQAGAGFLSEIQDPSGSTTYERDLLGRVTRKSQVLANGHTRSLAYQYGAGGLLAAITYPDARTLHYQRDATGQITGLAWAGQAIVQVIAWNPLGQPTGWSWSLGGTSIPATRSYNSAGQLTATEMASYQYDAAGRIHTVKQKLWRPANASPQAATLSQATSTWSAGYDSAGRLTGFTRTTAAGAPADSTAIEYDANGNLVSSQRERAGTSTTRSYGTEAGHNKLLGLEQTATSATGSTSASTTYQYDAAGNLQSDGLRQYHYDSQGRLQSASTGQGADAPTTRYAHNALGQRVFKTEALYNTSSDAWEEGEEGEQNTGFLQSIANFFARLWSPKNSEAEHLGWAYLYDEEGSLVGEYGMGGAGSGGQGQYFYLPTASGPLPIAAEIDGRLYAIHSDHLNTPRHLTQQDGQSAWQWAYSAYGDEAPTLGSRRFTNETTNPTTGSTGIPPVRFNLRYPGQYFDEETGLHYNWHRSYDPRVGRYTQSDPIGLDGGWNRFAYVDGNPFSYVDPDGKASLPLMIIGGGMFATGIYKYYDKNKKLEQCAQSCSLQCSSTVACGDPERTEQYSLNRGRCVNTCIPICVAEFIGGPKPGPTKPPRFPWSK